MKKQNAIYIMLLAIFTVITSVIYANRSTHEHNFVQLNSEKVITPKLVENVTSLSPLDIYANDLYKDAELASYNLDSAVFLKALTGYYNLKAEGKLSAEKSVLTISDFSKSSTEKRFWVIDLDKKKVLYNDFVAHGKNTGDEFAKKFSNINESNMSSLGFYVTGDTYFGKHGLSLYLDGVEQGINDKARERSIVVHGAEYATQQFINTVGRLGRSNGCPAVPQDISADVISDIAGKTVLFVYYPDNNYQANSKYLDNTTAAAEFKADTQLGMK